MRWDKQGRRVLNPLPPPSPLLSSPLLSSPPPLLSSPLLSSPLLSSPPRSSPLLPSPPLPSPPFPRCFLDIAMGIASYLAEDDGRFAAAVDDGVSGDGGEVGSRAVPLALSHAFPADKAVVVACPRRRDVDLVQPPRSLLGPHDDGSQGAQIRGQEALLRGSQEEQGRQGEGTGLRG